MKNDKSKPKIHVRKARPSDREAVFRFCEKTWSWGDYIPKVWDRWLKDENGRVFVATVNGVPVGISHINIDKSNEVWLRGARTDPNYRRIGVATAVTEKCLQYAKHKGAKVVRLVTESTNIAAQRVIEKLGFKPVAEFVETATEIVAQENGKGSRWAEETEIEVLWNYLQTSETYRRAAGLYTILFHWFSLEKQDLEWFVEQRKAILHQNLKGEVDGLMLIDDAPAREWHENTIQTCYIDGNYNTAVDMIKFLKHYCYVSGVKKIYGFACNRKPIVRALETLGFEPPEPPNIVYEKRI